MRAHDRHRRARGWGFRAPRRLEVLSAVTRALKLVGLGLLLALYPYFPVFTVRWPGVLQRIGICYLAAQVDRIVLVPTCGA
jgi:predicted acyltransferase